MRERMDGKPLLNKMAAPLSSCCSTVWREWGWVIRPILVSNDRSLESASLLNKTKHVSVTVTNRTSAYILQLYFMLQSSERTVVSLFWILKGILNSSVALFNSEEDSSFMFYGLSSSGGCPPFLALKVLQGCDVLCAMMAKEVSPQLNAFHFNSHHREQPGCRRTEKK